MLRLGIIRTSSALHSAYGLFLKSPTGYEKDFIDGRARIALCERLGPKVRGPQRRPVRLRKSITGHWMPACTIPAMKALQDSAFILKADKVTFRRGRDRLCQLDDQFRLDGGRACRDPACVPQFAMARRQRIGRHHRRRNRDQRVGENRQKRFRALPDERRGFGELRRGWPKSCSIRWTTRPP